MISIRDFYSQVKRRLEALLPDGGEAEAAARIIFEDVAGYTKVFIFANGDREITASMQERIGAVVDKVAAGMPVQYAVGKAFFMGNNFTVTPAVLIPRPETAGLVDMVVDDWQGRSDLHVLDIGTGSGCIAISLARALPFADVDGMDVSDDALAVARRNAVALKAKVDFEQSDILRAVPRAEAYDIIVSNPPYVTEQEAKDMTADVLDHEPHRALFVPDGDPLVFYKAIASYARKALKRGGKLYLEINQHFPKKMSELLSGCGFTDVAVLRDYKGNYRYATAKQP